MEKGIKKSTCCSRTESKSDFMSLQSIWIKNFLLLCRKEKLLRRHVYFYFSRCEKQNRKEKRWRRKYLIFMCSEEGRVVLIRFVCCLYVCNAIKRNFNVKLRWLMEIDFSVLWLENCCSKSPAKIYEDFLICTEKGVSMNHPSSACASLTHALGIWAESEKGSVVETHQKHTQCLNYFSISLLMNYL